MAHTTVCTMCPAPLFLVAAALLGCGGKATVAPQAPPAEPVAKNSMIDPAPADSASASRAAPAPEPPKPAPPSPVVKYTTGFALPESVLYDAEADRYLVSNINGAPADRDNNGFVSVLSPDGQVTALKWIEGGKDKVKLDAPKGMAMVNGVLYVADLTAVRMFDAKSGAPKGETAVPGSTFLNDLAAGPDGKIYVSDSGMKPGPDGKLAPSGTDAVYVIEKGHVKAIAKGADLGGPNGVVWTEKGILTCGLRSNEVYRIDDKGKKADVTTAPAGHLDGLLVLGESLLVTSHDGSAIYRGKLGGSFEVALADQKTPADIGYDTKRQRLLVPHLRENTVEVYDLK
ncbi:MAG TPA: hypothetical protein VE987_10855 [Polyangiaceae bacterium]|nr:hypothetical protein [Polyangiaceae bacterium]